MAKTPAHHIFPTPLSKKTVLAQSYGVKEDNAILIIGYAGFCARRCGGRTTYSDLPAPIQLNLQALPSYLDLSGTQLQSVKNIESAKK
jgi:hypothetical protein